MVWGWESKSGTGTEQATQEVRGCFMGNVACLDFLARKIQDQGLASCGNRHVRELGSGQKS